MHWDDVFLSKLKSVEVIFIFILHNLIFIYDTGTEPSCSLQCQPIFGNLPFNQK